MRLFKKLDELKGWITFIMMIGAGGFTIAMTLVGKASASRVATIEQRTDVNERDIAIIKAHHEDDDRLLDWLVRTTWMQHPELPSPPPRRDP